jgi:phage head maturation protease
LEGGAVRGKSVALSIEPQQAADRIRQAEVILRKLSKLAEVAPPGVPGRRRAVVAPLSLRRPGPAKGLLGAA